MPEAEVAQKGTCELAKPNEAAAGYSSPVLTNLKAHCMDPLALRGAGAAEQAAGPGALHEPRRQ